MTLPGLPSPTVPLQMPNGSINPVWYQYFVAVDNVLRAYLRSL